MQSMAVYGIRVLKAYHHAHGPLRVSGTVVRESLASFTTVFRSLARRFLGPDEFVAIPQSWDDLRKVGFLK